MRVIRSNRAERLVDALATELRERPLPPTTQETIIVQSHALRRWLSTEIASRTGICANTAFRFPRTALDEMLDTLLGDDGSDARARREAYHPKRLRWTIAAVLPELENLPNDIRARMADRPQGSAVELGGHLAQALERQLVYRPDEVLGWQRTGSGGWPGALWRAVRRRLGPHHIAERARKAKKAIDRASREGASDGLPPRLTLFGVETLPPLYAHLIALLARVVPTSLYLVRATPHYWGDERATRSRHKSAGHPLLGLCGKMSRDLEEVLLNADLPITEEVELFEDANTEHSLGVLQSSLIGGRTDYADLYRSANASISVHTCPTRMREVQVVHDVLRNAFETDQTLQPEDVLIVAPESEQYRALLESVLDDGEAPPIPHYFADPRPLLTDEWVRGFLRLVELLPSRWTRADVVDLLALNVLSKAYRLDAAELEHARQLVDGAGIRWGIDAGHRKSLGFPEDETHCWRAGLDRLLFGYAVHPLEPRPFAGAISTCAATRASAEVAAKIASFIETLAAFWRPAEQEESVTTWMRFFRKLALSLLSDDPDFANARSNFLECVRSAEQGATDVGNEFALTQTEALDALRYSLRTVGQSTSSGIGVTIAELSPFRSIPFRMTCVLGMSAREFPRASAAQLFDFTADTTRIGDRDRRADDLHAFLINLCAARDRVVITHSAELFEPDPSIAVTGLLEGLPESAEAAPVRVVDHALHPFEPRYFHPGAAAQSYSERMRDIARALSATPVQRITDDRVSPVEFDEVSTRALSATLWHPTRAFYRDRLGIFMRMLSVLDPDDETMSALDMWRAGTHLLDRLANISGDEASQWLYANPAFPTGVTGQMARERVSAEANQIVKTVETLRTRAVGGIPMQHRCGDVVIHAEIDGLADNRRLVTSFSREARASELQAWVDHLLVNAHRSTETVVVSRNHLGSPTTVYFAPVSDASRVLEQILLIYRHAMERPIPLFAQASREYALRLLADTPVEKAIDRAAKKFHSRGGDRDDPYVRRAFSDEDPFRDPELVESFKALASTVYQPWLASRVTR